MSVGQTPILQQKPSMISTDQYVVPVNNNREFYVLRNFLMMNTLASKEFENIMNAKPWTHDRALPLFILLLYIAILVIVTVSMNRQ